MASANRGATVNLVMFSTVSSSGLAGIELVTIILSMPEFLMFSKAFPLNSPCVAKA